MWAKPTKLKTPRLSICEETELVHYMSCSFVSVFRIWSSYHDERFCRTELVHSVSCSCVSVYRVSSYHDERCCRTFVILKTDGPQPIEWRRTWGLLPFHNVLLQPCIPFTLARVAFPSSILRPDVVPLLVEMLRPLGFRPLEERQHIVEIPAQRPWPRSPFTVSFFLLDNLCLGFLAVLLN